MKRKCILTWLICLLLLYPAHSGFAQIIKKIKVGNLQPKVADQADEGEGSMNYAGNPYYYFDGFTSAAGTSKAMFLGCRDFTDTLGVFNSVKVSGHGQWNIDDKHIWIPVPDKDGYTIHRYMRYAPPTIVVDGSPLQDPFPFDVSDHVDPGKIPGTADCMTESWINTDMGITIRFRTYAYSQKNHDDYVIYEKTFKNTGKTNRDNKVKLTQTLKDVYYLRQVRYYEATKGWASEYGFMPQDSLRILYGYPARWSTALWDDFGNVQTATGFLRRPFYNGEVILFGSDPKNVGKDDPNQPGMTGVQDCDLICVTQNSNMLSTTYRQYLYTLMKEGFSTYFNDGIPDMSGSKPGHHSPPFDQRGYQFPNSPKWFGYSLAGVYAFGPYTLAPGDSFKVAWAWVVSCISPEKAFQVGQAWKAGTATWGDNNPGGSTDVLPPQYKLFPSLYAADANSKTALNNWAKDNWICTGKDSLFGNGAAAQWAYKNNLNVPSAPPAPSIEVKSLSEAIRISWGNESETASDFAGYRIYRGTGSWYARIPTNETKMVGMFTPIFECGQGTANALTHTYDDKTAQRGIAYFYYVTAFDKGTDNIADFNGKKESLESGRWLNATTQAAYLQKPSGKDLAKIRIVPNPFSLGASQIQFTGEPDKIMLMNLPEECTITIYTEGGDLVQTIKHFGSGDQSWGKLLLNHSLTNAGQLIVSGIYIAHIQTPDGQSINKKFVVVR